MKYAQILLFGLALVACNDDGLGINNNTDGGNKKDGMSTVDMTVNNNPGQDLAMKPPGDGAVLGDLKGVSCGNESCTSTQQCCVQSTGGMNFSAMCVAPGQCADGGLVAACDGPEDCPSSDQGCCVDVNVAFGGMSMNPSGSGGASCMATCQAFADINTDTGVANIKSALCHQPSDCAGLVGDVNLPILGMQKDQAFSACCSASQGGATLTFCAPEIAATFGSSFGIECQ